MIINDHQKTGMEEHGSVGNFWGSIVSCNVKSGHNISLDDMPAWHKKSHAKRRNKLSVADPDEEEKDYYCVVDRCEKI